jgi:hypothetical protein
MAAMRLLAAVTAPAVLHHGWKRVRITSMMPLELAEKSVMRR